VIDPGELPWEVRLGGEAETEAAGGRLAALLGPGAVLRLHGDLGAGKTTLTRGVAVALGADAAAVHSPTFALVHPYRDRTGRTVLQHVDLYRIERVDGLREIGLEEILGGEVPVAVEWAERLEGTRFGPRAGDLEARLEVIASGGRLLRVRACAPTAPSGSSAPPS